MREQKRAEWRPDSQGLFGRGTNSISNVLRIYSHEALLVSFLFLILSISALPIEARGETVIEEGGITEIIDIRTNNIQIENLRPITETPFQIQIDTTEKLNSAKSGLGQTIQAFGAEANQLGTLDTGNAEIDLGLSFLRGEQEEDGSFGNTSNNTNLLNTFSVSDLFHSLSLTGDSAYENSILWLDKQYYENTQSEALKLLMLAQNGNDVLYSLEPIIARQGTDGGFGYSTKHESDPITSSFMLRAIDKSGYTDFGDDPDASRILLLIYILNAQNTDSGWGKTQSSKSDIQSTVAVLESLYKYKNSILATPNGDISVKNAVLDALSYLKQLQASDGKWNNALFETFLAYDILHTFGSILNYENEAFNLIKASQALNGSFLNGNILATAKGLQALAHRLNASASDLTITDISPITSLVNGTSSGFAVKIKNIGQNPVSSENLTLYRMDDNYNWWPSGASVLTAGTSLGIGQEITVNVNNISSNSFLGTTTLKYYVETTGDSDESNNWLSKEVFFSASPDGVPALPPYYVAFKASSGLSLRVRWPVKTDPNRANYVVLYRKLGETTWNGFLATNTTSGVIINNREEGATYETLVGVKDTSVAGTITYFSSATQVQASATSNTYTGNVSGNLTLNSLPIANSPVSGHLFTATSTEDTPHNLILNNLQNGTNAMWSNGTENDKIVSKMSVSNSGATTNTRVFTRIAEDTTSPNALYVRIKNNTTNSILNDTTSTLEFAGNDNVNVKEADLSYYNPETLSYVFIKTTPIIGSVSAYGTYNWFVPKTLSGNGFKLRAVLRDYKGNISSPVESMPFSIIAPNIAPTLEITRPNSTVETVDTNYTITWTDSDPDSNATISLYYDTDATGQDGTLITSGIAEDSATNEHTWDTNMVPNGNYFIYGIINDTVNTSVHDYSAGTITIYHPPVLIKPEPPTGLSGISTASTTATLSWTAPLNGGDKPITGYKIERKLPADADFANIISTTETTSPTYTDGDLLPATAYEYRVSAVSLAGIGSASNIASVTTRNPIAPTISVTKPNKTGETADASYVITWTDSDPDSNATISLFYDTDAVGLDGTLITSNISENNALNSYTWNTSAIPKGNYYVYAIIDDTEMPKVSSYGSHSIFIRHLPGAPINVTATNTGMTTMTVNWNPPTNTGSDPILGYEIFRKIPTSNYYSRIAPTITPTFMDKNLVASTTYNYVIRTVTNSGVSVDSVPATGTTATIPNWNLFTDSVLGGWTSAVTSLTATIPHTALKYSGTASIKLVPSVADGTFQIKKITGSNETTGKTTLIFAIQSSSSTVTSNLKINLLNASGTNLKTINLISYGNSTLPANTWKVYSIPLSALEGFNTKISGVRFTFGKTGTFYLDEIKLQ